MRRYSVPRPVMVRILAALIWICLWGTTLPAPVAAYTLSGQVTLDGSGLTGVWFPGLPGGVVTADDTWSTTVPDGWSGTVEPWLPGYRFEPETVDLTAVDADAVVDFAAVQRSTGYGRIYVVAPEDRLRDAFSRADSGDLILLLPGIHTAAPDSGNFFADGISVIGRGGPEQVTLHDNRGQDLRSSRWIVHGVSFEGNAADPALLISGSEQVWLRNCHLHSTGGIGLWISNSRDFLIEGGLWSDLEFGVTIRSGGSSGEIIFRNGGFFDNEHEGIRSYSNPDLEVVLENVEFRDNSSAAVELTDIRAATVRNCIFFNNGYEGLVFHSITNPVEVTQTVFAGLNLALNPQTDVDVEVHDSIFYNNTRGVNGGSSATVHIDHVMYQGGWIWGHPDYDLDLATITADDPLFTDPATGDFTLLPTSPARGIGRDGQDLGAYDGPLGAAWDPLPSMSEPALVEAFFRDAPRYLRSGDSRSYQLDGHYTRGFTAEVKALTQWSSSDESVLLSLGDGTFEAVADGVAEVIADVEGTTTRLEVRVSSSSPPLAALREDPLQAVDEATSEDSETATSRDASDLMVGEAVAVPKAATEPSGWTTADFLIHARSWHTSTLLSDGRVLVTGGVSGNERLASAEIYDLTIGRWSTAASMAEARYYHTATLLPDGRVLVAGGLSRDESGNHETLKSVEIYDPRTDVWTHGPVMLRARSQHTATLLADGTVLVAGSSAEDLRAEIYDPELGDSGLWLNTGPMRGLRMVHTATLLADGRVLVVDDNEAELYDPETFVWSEAPNLPREVDAPTATLLLDDRVLVAGGYPADDPATYLYHPDSNSWTRTSGDLQQGRAGHTAALLPDGRVMVVGGDGDAGDPVTTEVFDPYTETWSDAGSLSTPRQLHSMTLLPSGQVLLIGGESMYDVSARCDLYQPGPGDVTPAADLAELRYDLAATVLADGRVLVAGGRHSGYAASVEIYDPETDSWSPAAALATAGKRRAVLLGDGDVLAVDAWNAERYDVAADVWSLTGPRVLPGELPVLALLASNKLLAVSGEGAEIYDPATDTWTATGDMRVPRCDTTLTPLSSGEVLVAGGHDPSASPGTNAGVLTSVEVYDPVKDTWLDAARMRQPRRRHGAVPLLSGEVLVVGGDDGDLHYATAEIYDPLSDAWRLVADVMASPRRYLTATLLGTGQVLVAGGDDGIGPLFSTEILDPHTGVFRPGPSLTQARERHAAVLLGTGEVLVIGGRGADEHALGSVDRVAPRTWPRSRRPEITGGSTEISYEATLTVVGSELGGGSEAMGGGTAQSAVNHPVVQLQAVASGRIAWLASQVMTPAGALRPSFWDDPLTLTVDELPPDLDPGLYRLTVFRAGVPSAARFLPLECSIAITGQPQSQNVDLGGTVTFTVEAQGARSYQWRKNGLPIPDAVGASYTTPWIEGDDSGAVYDVVVSNPCASEVSVPAVVTVNDDQPPEPVYVVAPQPGEYWLLPPDADQPPRFETIAWEAEDNVRVCRVQVGLQYSDDGEDPWLPVPDGGGLPADFGSQGICPPPGETTRHMTYELPYQAPPGSFYRIELRVTDHIGLETVAYSDVFFIVKPDPDAVKTLIVTNFERMQLTPENADDLRTGLEELAAHPRVRGLLVDVGCSNCDIGDLYNAWDESLATGDLPEINRLANEVLFGSPSKSLSGIHDRLLDLLKDFTGVEYMVLVGDDRVIPMARLRDGATLYDETKYIVRDGELSPYDPLTVTQALLAQRYLSDDPLALLEKVENLDISVYLPDLAVGRLVEGPAEILTVIDAFLRQDGVLSLNEPETVHKVFVTGYDFLSDVGTVIRDRWQTALEVTPGSTEVGSLLDNNWGADELLGHMCGDAVEEGEPFAILSLNDHAHHYGEGFPGTDPHHIVGLDTSSLNAADACDGEPLDLTGRVIYSVGCHGGLPVPGNDPGDENHSLDMPQTLLGLGAVAYVANSGYGWGLEHGVGYTERLVQIFTEELTRGGTLSVGRTIVESKLRYFLEIPYLDDYDQKTLMQWTLFGLPMYAVSTGIAEPGESALPASSLVGLYRGAQETATPELTVRRSDEKDLTKQLPLPDNLILTELRINLSADGVYAKFDAAGEPLDLGISCRDADAEGCYYTINGLAAARSAGTGDLPLMPYLVYDSWLSGSTQHGVLWLGGSYIEEEGWRPLIGTLISNGGDGSEHTPGPQHVVMPPIGTRWGATRADPCRPTDLDVNSLVVGTGEILDGPDPEPFDLHRRYQDVHVEIFYLNSDGAGSCTPHGPVIRPGPINGEYHQVTGPRISWSVPVDDDSEVWRVVVVYDDLAAERWNPLELAFNSTSGFWEGSVVSPPGVESVNYVIQAIDNHGNVTWHESATAPLPEGTGIVIELPVVVTVPFEPGTADLELTIADEPDPVVGGDVLDLHLTVANHGPDVAGPLRLDVEDIDLPAGTASPTVVSADGWDCSFSPEPPLVSCGKQLLEVDAETTVILKLRTPAVTGLITTSAKVESTRDLDPVPSNNIASETTLILVPEAADLAIAVDNGVDLLEPGAQVTYDVTVTNGGPLAVDDVYLALELSPGLEPPLFNEQVGSFDGLRWSGLGLAAGASALLRLETRVTPDAIGGVGVTAQVWPPIVLDDPNDSNNTAADFDPLPGGAPAVVAVTTVADTGDGILHPGESTASAITQVLVAFSEDVTGAEGAGVHRLLSPGADGLYQTPVCAPVVGDDVLRTIEVSYRHVEWRTLLSFGATVLRQGRYRIEVCDGIANLAGEPLTGVPWSREFEIRVEHLLESPNFDNDLAPWSILAPAAVTVVHAADDAADAITSGSAELSSSGTTEATSLYQCVPVQPKVIHGYGGWMRTDSPQGMGPQVSVWIELFASPDCVGEAIDEIVGSMVQGAVSAWQALPDGRFEPPPETRSARVHFLVETPDDGAYQVHFDDLCFAAEPHLFRDGFEGGDTNEWSATEP
ncbi:MAG: hypothetical protein GY856_11835 [bacterium]|nr:hypothetical protein [bacterium]